MHRAALSLSLFSFYLMGYKCVEDVCSSVYSAVGFMIFAFAACRWSENGCALLFLFFSHTVSCTNMWTVTHWSFGSFSFIVLDGNDTNCSVKWPCVMWKWFLIVRNPKNYHLTPLFPSAQRNLLAPFRWLFWFSSHQSELNVFPAEPGRYKSLIKPLCTTCPAPDKVSNYLINYVEP